MQKYEKNDSFYWDRMYLSYAFLRLFKTNWAGELVFVLVLNCRWFDVVLKSKRKVAQWLKLIWFFIVYFPKSLSSDWNLFAKCHKNLYYGMDSTSPFARSLAHSLAPLIHFLALHCSLCSRAPLRSFVCSLAHSLTQLTHSLAPHCSLCLRASLRSFARSLTRS